MDYLIHFNPNHDPKSGRFTFTSDAQKRAMRAAKTKGDVDDIVSTFSNKERKNFGLNSKDEEYLSLDQGEYVIKRIVEKYNDVPVAFFDLLDDGETINVALGTRAGDEYRGKGYAKKAAMRGMKWYEKHASEFENKTVVWAPKKDNVASQNLAKKVGFTLDKENPENGEWVNYTKKYK